MSLFVEVDDLRLMFGTGMRGKYLLHNMSFMDIKPSSVETIVIPMDNKEYYGGLSEFLIDSEKTVVFAPSECWGKRGIRLSEEFAVKCDSREAEDWIELSEHLLLTPPIGGGRECFLVLITRRGPIVMGARVSCGFELLASTVYNKTGQHMKGFIGGVKLPRKPHVLAQTYSEFLRNEGCDILYMNHCTGYDGISAFRSNLGLQGVRDFYAGSDVEFDV